MRSLKLAAAEARGLLREYLDTVDSEAGTDALAGPRRLRGWLTARGLLEDDVEVTPEDVERTVKLRDGLRQLEADGEADRETVAILNWVASRALLRPRFGRRGDVWMEPAVDGFDGALARLLLIYQTSEAGGRGSVRKRRPSVGDRWLTRP